MAGVAKPNVADLGKEVQLSIISSFGAGSVNGLFDGTQINEWNTIRVFYWSGATSYVEFSVNQKVNIWRSGTGNWSGYTNKFIIYRYVDGAYVDITSSITQTTSAITHTQWEKTIHELPAGRYKFAYTGLRIDSEWYVEAVESLFLLKQNNQYYSIKPDFYDEELMMYEPLEGLDFSKGFNVDELFNIISIGSEDPINITPEMASNTTPAPYAASANGVYSSSHEPWKAFNGSITSDQYDCWVSSSALPHWIMINFGRKVDIDKVSITSRNTTLSSTAKPPKNFLIQGSNDGVSFETFKIITDEIGWGIAEERIYSFDTVSYQYYRIYVTANNGTSYTTIGLIKFLYDKPITEQFSPIDKFDNFTLISENASDINYNYQAIKTNSELIVANGDIDTTIVETINYFNLIASDNVKIAISIDNGKHWLTYNPVTDKFTKLNVNIPMQSYENLTEEQKAYWDISKNEILQNGININTFNSIDFNRIKSSSIRFAYVLNKTGYDDISEVDNLDWSFNSVGLLRLCGNSDGTFDVYEDRIEYESNVDVDMIKLNISV